MKIKTDIAKLLEESLDKYNSRTQIDAVDFFNSDYGNFLRKVVDSFLGSGEFILQRDSEKINWMTLMIIEELSVDITGTICDLENEVIDSYDCGRDYGYNEGYYNGYADAKMITEVKYGNTN